MKRFSLVHLVSLMSLILLVVLAFGSCASASDTSSVVGVWKEKDGDFLKVLTLTADGKYAYEEYEDKNMVYAIFGDYVADETCIFIDDDDYDFILDGKELSIDLFGENSTFKRTSKNARSYTSKSRLKGIWKSDSLLAGFTDSTAVCMGHGGSISEYELTDDIMEFEFDEARFAIINGKLYIDDIDYFFQSGSVLILEKEKDGGVDSSTRDILVQASPWHLIDVGEGTYNYIYNFSSNGTYNMEYYSDTYDDSGRSNGTFELSNHIIKLSNNTDLAYAVIDMIPFMFTI